LRFKITIHADNDPRMNKKIKAFPEPDPANMSTIYTMTSRGSKRVPPVEVNLLDCTKSHACTNAVPKSGASRTLMGSLPQEMTSKKIRLASTNIEKGPVRPNTRTPAAIMVSLTLLKRESD
jgi:hypothetical protein